VYLGLFESTISALYRVCFDRRRGILTLGRFKDTLCGSFTDVSGVDELREECKKSAFEIRRDEFRNQLKTLRHERIAHFKNSRISNQEAVVTDSDRVSLSQIEQIRDAANEYFRVLSLGDEWSMVDREYTPTYSLMGEEERQTEIDILLEFVAGQSPVLHLPETDQQHWSFLRAEEFTAADIVVLNKWRLKFGLPPVK
jgi:hypothetical protein